MLRRPNQIAARTQPIPLQGCLPEDGWPLPCVTVKRRASNRRRPTPTLHKSRRSILSILFCVVRGILPAESDWRHSPCTEDHVCLFRHRCSQREPTATSPMPLKWCNAEPRDRQDTALSIQSNDKNQAGKIAAPRQQRYCSMRRNIRGQRVAWSARAKLLWSAKPIF